MTRFATVLCLVSAVAGCHLRAPRPRPFGQLGPEAGLFVYLDPLPADAQRLTMTVEGVDAAGAGGDVPLDLALPVLAAGEVRNQRLLAFGKIPPGSYEGLAIRLKRATVSTAHGTSDLLIPEDAARVELPFTAAAGRAVVLWVTSRTVPPAERGFALAPSFTGAIPPKPVLELTGLSAATGWDSVVTFDSNREKVVSLLAIGGGPEGIALDKAQNRAYVTMPQDDEIRVIDLLSSDTVTTIRLGPGNGPREVALSPDGKLLVSINFGSFTASFIDPVGAVEIGHVPVGQDPSSILLDRSGRRAYVFNRRSNSITVLDLATRSVATTVPTDAEPLRGSFSRSGDRLYVVQAGSPYLSVFSVPEMTLAQRVFVGMGATAVQVDPRTDLVYVAKRDEGRLYVYESSTLLAIATIEVPEPVTYMTIDDPRNVLMALMPERRAVAVVDLTGRRLLSTFDLGDAPYSLVLYQQRP